jgi:hypothetical protein
MDTRATRTASMMAFSWLRRRPDLIDRLRFFRLAGRRTRAKFDPPRLHRLRNLSRELNLEQAVLKRRSLDLNMIFEVELPFERARRNALMKVLMFRRTGFVFGPAAGNGKPVLLRRNADFFR